MEEGNLRFSGRGLGVDGVENPDIEEEWGRGSDLAEVERWKDVDCWRPDSCQELNRFNNGCRSSIDDLPTLMPAKKIESVQLSMHAPLCH